MIPGAPAWVNQSLRDKGENTFITNLFYLMRELGWSWQDVMETPLPAINLMINEMIEHYKREEREAKKASRRK